MGWIARCSRPSTRGRVDYWCRGGEVVRFLVVAVIVRDMAGGSIIVFLSDSSLEDDLRDDERLADGIC